MLATSILGACAAPAQTFGDAAPTPSTAPATYEIQGLICLEDQWELSIGDFSEDYDGAAIPEEAIAIWVDTEGSELTSPSLDELIAPDLDGATAIFESKDGRPALIVEASTLGNGWVVDEWRRCVPRR